MSRRTSVTFAALLVVLGSAGTAWAQSAASGEGAPASAGAADAASRALAREIFKQLIEINTTDSVGSVTAAAEAIAERFRAAGFPAEDVFVGGPQERKKNLVVRLRGTGKKKPILLIGHLDVVEARREDWTTDPFQFVEKDGYFYGRGTQDMKDGDAVMTTTLLRLKKEGYRPSRDIILALTADEEGGCCNGPDWLIKNHRALIDAEFVLNHDGSSIISEKGVPRVFELGATEKLYGDYEISATNRGGHSSLPRPDNAIYQLAQGLLKVSQYQFPFELNNVTRAYFERMAAVSSGTTAADMRAVLATPPDPQAIERLSREPTYGSVMRTTCVATRLEGGHANNALPQRATAVVNCRIVPGHSPESIRQELIRLLADPQLTVRFVADNGKVSDTAPDRHTYPPAPLVPEVKKPLDDLVGAMWPGLKVIPSMSAGASDGIYTSAAGWPTYTVAGVAIDRDDVRAHGRDERLGAASFYTGNEFFYRYLKAITAK